jgi:LacI family transcriptional regulator
MTLNGLNFLLNRCYEMARPVERNYAITVTQRASVARVRA